MAATTCQIKIPQKFLDLGVTPADVQDRVIEWLALSLFVQDRISFGKAAELLGISRVEWIDRLREHGIAYLDWSEDEIRDEIAAVAEYEPPATA